MGNIYACGGAGKDTPGKGDEIEHGK